MSKFGIMQGRLMPEYLDQLQVFPLSHWREELAAAKNLGFQSVEILVDSKKTCEEVFFKSTKDEIDSLKQNIRLGSACLDRFCHISLLKEPLLFIQELELVAKSCKKFGIKTLVIPFLGENFIGSSSELSTALSLLKKFEIDPAMRLSLEVPLAATEILSAFKGKDHQLGLCYDLGNAKGMGFNISLEIQQLGKLINHVHIKDKELGGDNVPLGTGAVDFVDSFRSFNKIAYSGDFVLEVKYISDPIEEMRRHLIFIQECWRRSQT